MAILTNRGKCLTRFSPARKILRDPGFAILRPKPARRSSACLLCLLLASVALVRAAQSASEHQVKSAFLFNFAKFVEWPSGSFPSGDTALQICVLGQDPFGGSFEPMIEDKTVGGHRLELAYPDGVPQARACQILFIASSERPKLAEILRGITGASVLTVSDTPGFAEMGGMINFVLEEKRVRFEINLKAAERAHLKLSARL